MLKPKARWQVAEIVEEKVNMLARGLDVSPYVAKLLLNRGIDTVEKAKQFLFKEKVEYYDPYLLSDMEKAVKRIQLAIEKNEHILIYGDYDADGVSSTAVMIYTLKQLGAKFSYYIPNRFTEGYGPNENAFRKAKESGVSLIITVDTGISAVHEVEVAKQLGIDIIITDHHEAPPILPDAFAIINPKKPDCPYPFKGLAGVGVAFKVAHALLGEAPKQLLDIVAIGTIADLVPLMDENRLFAKQGIQALQLSTKVGIRVLKKACGIDQGAISADHIAFAIGPRINAAGRLESAEPALRLLITEDQEEAEFLVEEIETLNRKRQSLVNEIFEEAIVQVETYFSSEENKVLIVGGENWNPGVIGIVASRLVERYYRPTIVMSYDHEKGIAKGSARSIEGFDMFKQLSESRDILPHFGGHPMAAGLTMNVADVEILRKRLNQQAAQTLTPQDYVPMLKIDFAINIEDINVDLINEMEMLAPYGVSNPAPKLILKNVSIDQMKKIGTEENHLKILFSEEDGKLDSVGFHKGYLFEEITPFAKVSAVGTLAINEWNGYMKPQLFLEDLAVDEWQLFDWRNAKQIAELITTLPKEKRVLLCFQQKTIEALKLEDYQEEIQIVAEQNELQNKEGTYLILLDLPDQLAKLIKVLQTMEKPERIYSVFYQHEHYFFSVQPNREQFKWYYAFLRQRQSFDLYKYGSQLASYKKWSKDSIEFMTKVFLELEFVTMVDGIIYYQPNPVKKDLSESITYRTIIEQSKLENLLVYSSYHELKQWFDEVLENRVKEKVERGF